MLRSLSLYTGLWLTRMRHSFREIRKKRLKFLFSAFLSFIFMLLAGGGIFQIIRYVREVPIVGTALVIRLTGMIFMALLLLLSYSSVITSFSTLFFAEDNEFLFLSPFHTGGLILGKLLQTALYASWMSLLILIPFTTAMGYVYGLSLSAYILSALGAFLFFITVAAGSMTLVILLVRVFPARKMRDLMIVGLVGGGTVFYVFFRLLNIEQVLRPGQESLAAEYLSLFAIPNTPYLPSYWMTSLMATFLPGGSGSAGSLIPLILFALGFGGVYYLTAQRYFYTGWEKVRSQERKRYVPKKEFSENPVLAKDFRNFMRDTSQWTQALIIGALIVIYIVNVYKMPLESPHLHYLIAFLNIGMVGFVLSAVGLRFTFSSISLEGKYFWLLLSSPIEMKRLFKLKFLESFIPIEILGLLLVFGSNYILRPPTALYAVSVITVALMGLTISVIGSAMGAIYPKLDAAGPAEIETSWGGLMYMIGSFFYILISLMIIATWARMDFLSIARGADYERAYLIFSAAALLGVNAIVAFISVKSGYKALEKLEFNI